MSPGGSAEGLLFRSVAEKTREIIHSLRHLSLQPTGLLVGPLFSTHC